VGESCFISQLEGVSAFARFAGCKIQLLKVENISKYYPSPRGTLRVLSDVSLTLSRGEAASIMGPSGSGKSTLLYILGALEPPTVGTVTMDGQNPFQLNARRLATFRNKEIGFIFQDHCLLPQCSVLENVLTPTLVSENHGDHVGRARGLIEQVGLQERIDHRPAELSGGEKQRVALARALIMDPQLVLCDEPTGNLDQKSADAVASLFFELHERQQTILIVVTHNPELAARFPRRLQLRDQRLEEV
jgi:lipoprotein-releasing system ATP-binding protein